MNEVAVKERRTEPQEQEPLTPLEKEFQRKALAVRRGDFKEARENLGGTIWIGPNGPERK